MLSTENRTLPGVPRGQHYFSIAMLSTQHLCENICKCISVYVVTFWDWPALNIPYVFYILVHTGTELRIVLAGLYVSRPFLQSFGQSAECLHTVYEVNVVCTILYITLLSAAVCGQDITYHCV